MKKDDIIWSNEQKTSDNEIPNDGIIITLDGEIIKLGKKKYIDKLYESFKEFIGIFIISSILISVVFAILTAISFIIKIISTIGLVGIGLIAFIIYMYIDAKHKRNQIRTHKQKQDVLSDIQEDFDLKKEAYAEYLSETESELDMEEDEKSLDLEISKRYNNRGDSK